MEFTQVKHEILQARMHTRAKQSKVRGQPEKYWTNLNDVQTDYHYL